MHGLVWSIKYSPYEARAIQATHPLSDTLDVGWAPIRGYADSKLWSCLTPSWAVYKAAMAQLNRELRFLSDDSHNVTLELEMQGADEAFFLSLESNGNLGKTNEGAKQGARIVHLKILSRKRNLGGLRSLLLWRRCICRFHFAITIPLHNVPRDSHDPGREEANSRSVLCEEGGSETAAYPDS
ncbi:hypothetical protein JAAARDRAFT_47024 [Jaapia argillacea MUCL 33604]|uniref:Uncharacterized protein n=1 Tax=Jaapia argillacea MUCL 33604 TaxID=933084 RepID=A0A067PV77_9AGAM|nr:hypothetical protein JAAARDRAFT_47024 [Jaapia argillacea MUCL 33604]